MDGLITATSLARCLSEKKKKNHSISNRDILETEPSDIKKQIVARMPKQTLMIKTPVEHSVIHNLC